MGLNAPSWMDLTAIAHAALCLATSDGCTAAVPGDFTYDPKTLYTVRAIHDVTPRVVATSGEMLRVTSTFDPKEYQYLARIVTEVDEYTAAWEDSQEHILIPVRAHRQGKTEAFLCIVWSNIEYRAVDAWVGVDNKASTGVAWAVVPLFSDKSILPEPVENTVNYIRKAITPLMEAWPGNKTAA